MGNQTLADISYTLLLGRQHFNHRFAVVIQDHDQAIALLKQLGTREKLPNLFEGEVARGFQGTKVMEEYGRGLLRESASLREQGEEYRQGVCGLMDLYCQGYDLAWGDLFAGTPARRIHLPTYPFSRAHYWAEKLPAAINGGPAQEIPCRGVNLERLIPAPGVLLSRINSEWPKDHAEEMDGLLHGLLLAQLQAMALFPAGEVLVDDLKTRVDPLYGPWLAESISFLAARNHHLTSDGIACRLNPESQADPAALWKEWGLHRAAWLRDSHLKERVPLLEATIKALPEILSGKRPATEVIFPNSSLALVEGIYADNPLADTFNRVLADSVAASLRQLIEQDPRPAIRILEIGAGSGGTSRMLLKVLQPFRTHIKEYCYTDISRAFLLRAQGVFGPDNPAMTFKAFDVERSISGQDVSPGAYDIVIATNVLHATKNIRHSLRHVKATLKRNGLLFLNELSANALFTHLTFGLLKGWWRHDDTAIRIPGCPGLAPETWRTVLEEEGFSQVCFPAAELHGLGQQIVVAASDGLEVSPEIMPAAEPGRRERSEAAYVAPAGETETMLAGIWCEVLGLERVDVEDDFFELGGHSLLGTQVMNRVRALFGVELGVPFLFESSKFKDFAARLKKDVLSALDSSAVNGQMQGKTTEGLL